MFGYEFIARPSRKEADWGYVRQEQAGRAHRNSEQPRMRIQGEANNSAARAGGSGHWAIGPLLGVACISAALVVPTSAHAAEGSAAGTVTEYPITTPASHPLGMTVGPDANLWFTELHGAKIGTMAATGTIPTEYGSLAAHPFPVGIVAGADGNVWFAESASGKIGKMNTDGVMLGEYSVTGAVSDDLAGIMPGPDGNLWFTQSVSGKIGKMNTDGVLLEQFSITTPGAAPSRIVPGPDGNLWFTEVGGSKIAKMTTAGALIAEYSVTAGAKPGGTTAGPDGNIWFTEAAGNAIGRVTSGSPVPTVTSIRPSGATIGGTVYPGGATGTVTVECATNIGFTSGLVHDTAPSGSPSTSSGPVTVTGTCTGLPPGTNYFARIITVYSTTASFPTNTIYTTIASFTTPVIAQTPARNCVIVPPKYGKKALHRNSVTRLTKRGCVTNAGQRVNVRARNNFRGDVRFPRVFFRSGSWWIRTYETPTRTRIVWSAPATSTYGSYRRSVVRNS